MADRFTETTTTSYGSRIISSIKGIVAGIFLLLASFSILYWNEGTVDLSSIAKTAREIPSDTATVDASLSGKLLSTTGIVSTDQTVGDNLYLPAGDYISVERRVEMYSWVEQSESTSNTNTGGSETTQTTYTYSKEWKEAPANSSNFKQLAGHENPQKSLDSVTHKVTNATIGAFTFNPQAITLPQLAALPLSRDLITLDDATVFANDRYLFKSRLQNSTFADPQIGDLRISYHVLRPGFSGTIFGTVSNGRIEPYIHTDDTQLFRLFNGNRAESIAMLRTEHSIQLWALRVIGFMLMWAGLGALFGPISVLLDFFPIFGAISRSIISLVTFVLATILTLVTILVSILLHNIVALIVALILVLGGIIGVIVILKNKKEVRPVSNISPSPVPPQNPLQLYISTNRAQGVSDDQIRQALLGSGWPAETIDSALISS